MAEINDVASSLFAWQARHHASLISPYSSDEDRHCHVLSLGGGQVVTPLLSLSLCAAAEEVDPTLVLSLSLSPSLRWQSCLYHLEGVNK